MKRYIKLEGRWIDTFNSAELDIEYTIDESGNVWRYFNDDSVEEYCGHIQDESDVKPEEAYYLCK